MQLHCSCYIVIKIYMRIPTTNPPCVHCSRATAGIGAALTSQHQQHIPPHMRQQVNQAVGQAVTNAAMNELSNVFASKFK